MQHFLPNRLPPAQAPWAAPASAAASAATGRVRTTSRPANTTAVRRSRVAVSLKPAGSPDVPAPQKTNIRDRRLASSCSCVANHLHLRIVSLSRVSLTCRPSWFLGTLQRPVRPRRDGGLREQRRRRRTGALCAPRQRFFFGFFFLKKNEIFKDAISNLKREYFYGSTDLLDASVAWGLKSVHRPRWDTLCWLCCRVAESQKRAKSLSGCLTQTRMPATRPAARRTRVSTRLLHTSAH